MIAGPPLDFSFLKISNVNGKSPKQLCISNVFCILLVLKSTPERGGKRREIVTDEDDEESKKVITQQLFVT